MSSEEISLFIIFVIYALALFAIAVYGGKLGERTNSSLPPGDGGQLPGEKEETNKNKEVHENRESR